MSLFLEFSMNISIDHFIDASEEDGHLPFSGLTRHLARSSSWMLSHCPYLGTLSTLSKGQFQQFPTMLYKALGDLRLPTPSDFLSSSLTVFQTCWAPGYSWTDQSSILHQGLCTCCASAWNSLNPMAPSLLPFRQVSASLTTLQHSKPSPLCCAPWIRYQLRCNNKKIQKQSGLYFIEVSFSLM